METNFYTSNGWKGSRYDSSLSTAQISAKIRDYLREHYKGYKWRVRSENYSGGSSISVTLVSGPVPVMVEGSRKYISTSSVGLHSYENDLTAEAFAMMKDVASFAISYNRSDSDGMIDYFDERFYLRLHVGDFGAPYVIKENKAVHRLGVESAEVLRKQAALVDVQISKRENAPMERTEETKAANAALMVVDGNIMRDLRFKADNGREIVNRGTAVLLHPEHGFLVMPGDEGCPYSPAGGADALREILSAGGFLNFEGFRVVWPVGHGRESVARLLASYFNSDEVRLVEYSTKAVALVGNTRPLAAKLKELGGKFNPNLTCGAGWIFSKTRAAVLCTALGVVLQ